MAKYIRFIVALVMGSVVALYVATVIDTSKYFDHNLNYKGPKHNILYEDILGFGYYPTIFIFMLILTPLVIFSLKLKISRVFIYSNIVIFLFAGVLDYFLVRSIENSIFDGQVEAPGLR